MRIGIDLDGVTYDFTEAYGRIARIMHPDEALPYPAEWNFFKNQWGWTTDEYFRVFAAGVMEGNVFWRGQPIEGAKEGIEALRAAGHEVFIVTHRDHPDPEVANAMKRATLYWLQNHNIQVDAILFAGVKTNLGINVMLDDAPHNAEAAVAAGEDLVIFDQPWNAPRHLSEDAQSLPRVKSWPEFVAFIADVQEVIDMGLAVYA